MSALKLWSLPVLAACLATPHARAQAWEDGCASPEIRKAVSDSLVLEPICDHYSPETMELRRERLRHLERSYPACYASISSDPQFQDLKRETPMKIAELENEADNDMKRTYNEVVRRQYVEQCKKLADGELAADPAQRR